MEGDITPLPELRKIADEYHARIYLDEAHAIGVLGDHGKGTTEHFHNQAQADIIMCTFSKAFASIGGFVAGSERVIDYISILPGLLCLAPVCPLQHRRRDEGPGNY